MGAPHPETIFKPALNEATILHLTEAPSLRPWLTPFSKSVEPTSQARKAIMFRV